jgi:hypothetical protein
MVWVVNATPRPLHPREILLVIIKREIFPFTSRYTQTYAKNAEKNQYKNTKSPKDVFKKPILV